MTKLIPSEASVGPKILTLAELGQYSKAATGFVPFIYFRNVKHNVLRELYDCHQSFCLNGAAQTQTVAVKLMTAPSFSHGGAVKTSCGH